MMVRVTMREIGKSGRPRTSRTDSYRKTHQRAQAGRSSSWVRIFLSRPSWAVSTGRRNRLMF